MSQATVGVSMRSRTFAALGNADYRRFYIGQGISLIGTWLQAAAVSWIVFEQTGSERMLGLIETANIMPGLLVGLLAGAMADKVRPRTMLVVTQVLQMALAFILGALVAYGVETVWEMALIVALARICATFEMPSRQVFLYDLVGKSSLMNAIALNTGLFNASRVVGPALAGVVLARVGGATCFVLNGASYLASIAAVLMIRAGSRALPAPEPGSDHFWAGVGYLFRNRRIAALFGLMSFFGVVGMGYSAMLPAYAARVIGTREVGFSLLLASSGIGATVGALTVASLGGMPSGRRHRMILGGLALFSLALIGSAMLPPAVSPAMRMPVGSVCLMLIGYGAVVFYSTTQTVIQTTVPDHLRGRIMGIWMIAFSGSVPIGAMASGELAQAYTVPPVMAWSGLICLVAAGVVGMSGALRERP